MSTERRRGDLEDVQTRFKADVMQMERPIAPVLTNAPSGSTDHLRQHALLNAWSEIEDWEHACMSLRACVNLSLLDSDTSGRGPGSGGGSRSGPASSALSGMQEHRGQANSPGEPLLRPVIRAALSSWSNTSTGSDKPGENDALRHMRQWVLPAEELRTGGKLHDWICKGLEMQWPGGPGCLNEKHGAPHYRRIDSRFTYAGDSRGDVARGGDSISSILDEVSVLLAASRAIAVDAKSMARLFGPSPPAVIKRALTGLAEQSKTRYALAAGGGHRSCSSGDKTKRRPDLSISRSADPGMHIGPSQAM